MKAKFTFYLSLAVMMLIFNILPVMAQEDDKDTGFDLTNPMQETSAINAGLGYTRIGEDNYVGFRITPDLSLGKFGIGLDIPLMFNLSNGKLHTEEFEGGVGALRMISYVRWGIKKRDPFYIKLGDISGAYLGYGLLLNNYTNSYSFEKRKLGVEFDLTIAKVFGMEFIYSDLEFSSLNLMGIRPYIRPFGQSGIPIVKTFEIGGSYIVDKDNTSFTIADSVLVKSNYFIRDNGMSAWGADAGFLLFNTKILQWRVYGQYGNLLKTKSDSLAVWQKSIALNNPDSAFIMDYDAGSGISVGTDVKFRILGNVLRLDARIERVWYSSYFAPQFFDAGYEMNKDAKLLTLMTAKKKAGIYGSLYFSILDKISVGGGLMIPDDVNDLNPAMLQLNLDASRIIDKIILTGSYYKGGIGDLSDAFKVDDRSLINIRAAYKLVDYKFLALVVGVDYKWTFSPQDDGTFKARNYISPYFGLNIPLFGGNKGGDDEITID